MDILCHIMQARQIHNFGPWPHHHEAVVKCGLACYGQCLTILVSINGLHLLIVLIPGHHRQQICLLHR